MDQLRRTLVLLPNLSRTLALIRDAAPRPAGVWMALLLIQGLLPVATVFLTRSLVNSLVEAKNANGSWETLEPALILVASMAGIMVLGEVIQSIAEWIRTMLSEQVQDHVSALVQRKSVEVDLAFYDSPEYYDRLHRARSEARTRPLVLLENLGALCRNSITLVAMAAVLLPYGAFLPFVLIASTAPAFMVLLRFNRKYHRWWEASTPVRRRTEYYDTMLTHNAAAAEMRAFDLGSYFIAAYQALRSRLRWERLSLIRAQSLARLAAGASALLISGMAMAWIVWRALQGAATLGDLALFYQAFSQGQGLLRSILGNIGEIYSNSLFLGNLFEFLALERHVLDPAAPTALPEAPRKGIRFRGVTFRYPGSERTALRNFDLHVPAGQTVAIVGANGAGKSTLLKLLCRFYDPTEGRVELDGIDLHDISAHELRKRISILFQFPQVYYTTVGQNIALGDLSASPSHAEILAAARAAGADDVVARLPRGFDTLIGNWFADGTELSGGELQRVALARAFLRQAPIIVLDEPTSFMDSWAEIAWLERFRELVRGRTALIVTHRFTTAMHAHIIHVMDSGQIVESGTHEELVSCGGLYARSWNAQMSQAHRTEIALAL